MSLLTFTPKGIYCPPADVYIDPWKPVKKALITHGHSDHSRPGHEQYLCTHSAKPVINYRLGNHIKIQSVAYKETVLINGVKFSFHPAGHIIGSAQIRAEYKGEIWVASGDYKTEDDGLAEAFEPVKCHGFITESTFGMPIYKWRPQAVIAQEINEWWQKNKEEGKVSVLGGYALGKAQRLLQMLDPSIGKIFTHGAVENINEVLRRQGVNLYETTRITQKTRRKEVARNMIICPPSSLKSTWIKRFEPVSTAIGSGWMMMRRTSRGRSIDKGFVLSDHADWEGLNETVKATGAERIIVTHGYTQIYAKWLNEQGYHATGEKTEFEGENLALITKDEKNVDGNGE